MSTIAERVARGAAFLDTRMSGWWRVGGIVLGRLRMSDGCFCVVGQLYPDTAAVDPYDETPFTRALEGGWLDLDYAAALALGFFVDPARGARAVDAEYRALTEEWTRVITERRAAA